MEICLLQIHLTPFLPFFFLSSFFHPQSTVYYANRTLVEAFCILKNGERKKLIAQGLNSTTWLYFVTGIEPCDTYSLGWTESLELFGSYNGLKTKRCDDDQSQFYDV